MPARPRPPVLVLTSAAVLLAACGQYRGVHRAGRAADPVVQHLQPAVAQGPATATGGPTVSAGTVIGDDGAQGPKGATVVGTPPSLSRGVMSKAPPRRGGDGDGQRASGSPARGGGSRAGRTGTGRRSPDRSNGGDRGIAGAAQRRIRSFAAHNKTVLPAGFPFVICPVQGRYSYSDDYGAPRYAGGYHPHAGNDVFAVLGTPVVAPLTGYVRRAENVLGGRAVKVIGASGYVYMAHLSRYWEPSIGRVVPAGTVVGFVGNTGDARGTHPHNHFEWHPNTPAPYDRLIPGTRGAVDPFIYLRVVCPPA